MKKIQSPLELAQVATPSTPAAGFTVLYAKSDGKLYRMGSDGVETAATDIPLSPTLDTTVAAGSSVIVNRKYTIASGKKLTLNSGSIFRII